MASKEGKQFQSSLRQRIGMPEPEQKVAEAWTALEESLARFQPAIESLQKGTKGSPDLEGVAEDIVSGFEAAVTAVEAVEELLQAEGLIPEDDELLEPDDHGPDA